MTPERGLEVEEGREVPVDYKCALCEQLKNKPNP